MYMCVCACVCVCVYIYIYIPKLLTPVTVSPVPDKLPPLFLAIRNNVGLTHSHPWRTPSA